MLGFAALFVEYGCGFRVQRAIDTRAVKGACLALPKRAPAGLPPTHRRITRPTFGNVAVESACARATDSKVPRHRIGGALTARALVLTAPYGLSSGAVRESNRICGFSGLLEAPNAALTGGRGVWVAIRLSDVGEV
jgi:hypothetical protein